MNRAVVVHAAGDLRLQRRPSPEPGRGEVAIRIRYGGICGSDLHYWRHGRVGDFALREPMVLGHEVVGTVHRLGPGTGGPQPGTPVAVHPATPCGHCPECRSGRRTVCRDTRYLGSAARMPHVQGGFADLVVVPAEQALPLPDGLALRRAAIAEPASVAWHAAARAGDVRGRTVLVTGAGPIGSLVVAALRRAGAGRIIACDLLPEPLEIARQVGADSALSSPELAALLSDPVAGFEVDVAIESSGAPPALRDCVRATRRGGRVVALGLQPPGDSPVPGAVVVSRELELVGSFRFDGELAEVLAALADGWVTDPVVTHVLPVSQVQDAFALAADPARSGKVLLDFTAPDVTRPDPETFGSATR